MFSNINGNLTRQFKALEYLDTLLEEEFELLQQRDTDAVTNQEFSIHELLRQIAVERIDLRQTLQNTPVLDYASILSEDEQKESIRRLYYLIDSLEQRCARQASRNAELSLALLDQGQKLLTFLHDQLTPRSTDVYGARGKLRQSRPSATIYSGRM